MNDSFFREKLLIWEKNLEMYHKRVSSKTDKDHIGEILNLDRDYQNQLQEKINDLLLYTYHLLQALGKQEVDRIKAIEAGLIFRSDLTRIEHMKKLSMGQLTYIVQNQYKKYQLMSIVQGGLVGSIGRCYGLTNLPFQFVNQLRLIHMTGLTFGHEMNSPYEMILALKTFLVSNLPNRYQYEGWIELKKYMDSNHLLQITSSEGLSDYRWIHFLANQFMQATLVKTIRKHNSRKKSWLSIGLGAGINFWQSKHTYDFILKFYQYRYLKEKNIL